MRIILALDGVTLNDIVWFVPLVFSGESNDSGAFANAEIDGEKDFSHTSDHRNWGTPTLHASNDCHKAVKYQYGLDNNNFCVIVHPFYSIILSIIHKTNTVHKTKNE